MEREGEGWEGEREEKGGEGGRVGSQLNVHLYCYISLQPASKQVVKGLLDKHRSAAPPPQQPPAKAKQSPSSSEGAAAKEKEKEKPEKSAPPSSGKKAPSKVGSAAKGKVCGFCSDQCV